MIKLINLCFQGCINSIEIRNSTNTNQQREFYLFPSAPDLLILFSPSKLCTFHLTRNCLIMSQFFLFFTTGVGKSTVGCMLAQMLASQSKKVGMVDLDICGPSVPKLLSTEGQVVVNTDYGWKTLL